jgi:hypothetical protein
MAYAKKHGSRPVSTDARGDARPCLGPTTVVLVTLAVEAAAALVIAFVLFDRTLALLAGFAGAMLMSFVGLPLLLAAMLDVTEDAALNRSTTSFVDEGAICGVAPSLVAAAAESNGSPRREATEEELGRLRPLERRHSEGGAVARGVREDDVARGVRATRQVSRSNKDRPGVTSGNWHG